MSKYKILGYKGPYGNQRKREAEGRSYVRYKCGPMKTIQDVLKQRPGWLEVKEEEWDFHWCEVSWMRDNYGHSSLEDHVRICHFGNHYELTRKNLMVKNLKRYRKLLERELGPQEATRCDFFPCTFDLPCEYHLFVEEYKRNPGSTWIMKPAARSQGKGIFLFRKLKDIMDWKRSRSRAEDPRDEAQVESYVVQHYIENPYLINGRKFDLRVYVLVTSYAPLRAWLYRDGFARFSSTRFSLSSIGDQYVHLTNVAVQRTAPDYDRERGCKWQMQQLRRYLTARHGEPAVDVLFQEVDNIFIRSLLSVHKVIINDKRCFELYGYDIILDAELKPWLIEVNASPSLTATSQEDYELKYRLLEDTLHVVDMEGRLTGREKQVGGFDLMWNDGPVWLEGVDSETLGSSLCTAKANTHLGCFNNRKNQLRQLLKPFSGQRAT
ncbi:probable tubulin polyglutamylase TTLL9 [Megalops cyprinoides]|uniref:probable tubulin polyglutamylase TTLL9 n=1 Tax=Megalops cyprinoides TaxID=118141 RepID=UPI0018648FF8|nr:probable tubulin polyglutamylase TTLL9 [Megalops cyprinoides]